MGDAGLTIRAALDAAEDAAQIAGCPPGSCAHVTSAILAALSAAGYALVPHEPTRAMVEAAMDRQTTKQAHGDLLYHDIWRAMVARAEREREKRGDD